MFTERERIALTRWNRGRPHLASVCGEEARQAGGGRLSQGWSGIGEQHHVDVDECHRGDDDDPKATQLFKSIKIIRSSPDKGWWREGWQQTPWCPPGATSIR